MAELNPKKESVAKPEILTTSISLSSQRSNPDLCGTIEECPSLQHIKEALAFYQKIYSNDDVGNIDDEIMKYFDKYKGLINDYHHIILQHLSTGNKTKDNKNFNIIDSIIRESIKCDISDCKNYKRNHRNRRKQRKGDEYKEETLMNDTFNLEHSGDPNVIFYKEFLDSIHCYFLHAIDVGFRIQINDDDDDKGDDNKHDDEKQINYNDLDTESTDLYKDKQIEKMSEYLKKKRKKLQEIRGVNRVQYNKFSTDISKDNLQKQQIDVSKNTADDDNENNNDDTKGDDDDEKVTLYSFGFKYYYWDFFKDREWYIPIKYKNFEEEMLNLLPKKQYEQTMMKAKKMFNGDEIRRLYSHEWKNYGIGMGEPIREEHIMAVALYTDYDELSYKFSSSFRKMPKDQNNEDIKKRNMEYREWSRILRETVECYGTTMAETKIKIFYHGVSKIYFDSFIATFCCPTSTTAQLEVATIFADTSGIILELEKSFFGDSLRYFNCSLLSCYGQEDERLFIGGKQPLQFRSIRMISNKHNYKHFVKALSLFDKIINSQMLSEDEVKRVTKTDYKVIDAMIKQEIGEKVNKFPEYINTCFKTFVSNKNVVKFNLAYMTEQYPLFCETFLDKAHSNYFLNNMDNNLLAFDYIANIFKKCEEIHSIRTDPAQNVFTGQGFMYLDSLVAILNTINKNGSIQLKRIKIFGKRDLTDNDLYTNFKTYILDKAGWNLKINDNQLIISRD